MKKQLKYISVAATLLLVIACDSFTEVPAPDTQIESAQIFVEKSTATAALADIYARIREEGLVTANTSGATVLLANYSDDLQFFGNNTRLEQFANATVLPSNTYIDNVWRATYSQIYAVNAFLEGISKSENITEQDKNQFLGEAYFLRAYLHFYLTNCFGQIPYVTSTDYKINKTIPKNTETQIHDYILDDLEEASQLIQENYPTTERVRPNKATVNALLARVHLYGKNWESAQQYASLVINNALYSWQDNIELEFLKDNPSIIWSLHPGIAGVNTRDAQSFVVASGPPTKPTMASELYASFEPNDLRKVFWTKEIEGDGGPWHYAYKYKQTTNTGASQEYTILFRLAEIYLIRAESRTRLGNLQGAKNDLNKIRNRAGLPDTQAITQQEVLQAIAQERRVELFTEQGHRFFDLKRTDKADETLTTVKPNWKPTNKVLPLPENELLLNKNILPQNPGYE